MFKPDAARVNELDWEFMLSERFPSVPRIQAGEDWLLSGLDWITDMERRAFITKERQALVNAWPTTEDGGLSIQKWVERLEKAFDAKPPAVSTPSRGETRTAFEHAHDYGQPSPRRQTACERCGNCTRTGSSYCRPCEKIVQALGCQRERLNRVSTRFADLKIKVKFDSDPEGLIVRILSWDSQRWSALRDHLVMTLTDAEIWLDFNSPDRHTELIRSEEDYQKVAEKSRRKILEVCGVPTSLSSAPSRSSWG